jgi:pilus assembly protein FimV
MRRYLPRLIMTGALLSPATLYALGLGEIRLNSALNQPFDAEIELLAPTAEDMASLKVGLAPNDMFARYGLDRPQYLSNFDFSVARTRDGRTVIKVTSNRSVTEPFVTLLIEATSGRGRLLREYTVLLDPPTFMPTQPEQTAPVTAPRSGTQPGARIERTPEPAAAPAPAAAPEEPSQAASTGAAPGGTYTVQRNDTLWNIASSINPGSRRVVNRTMIALYRSNPGAFSGNINRLRAGAELRVPDLAEIEAVSLDEASAEVVRQTQEWTGTLTASAPPEDTSRLRLVPPEETPPAPAPAPQAPATQPAAEPRSQTPGAAPGAQPEADRRLEVQSPGLAEAQRQTAPPQPAETPAAPATETPPAAQSEPPAETPPEPAPAQTAPAPVAQEPAGPSLFERIGQFWWVPVAAGLLVVLGLILAFLKRRRESAELAEAFEPTPVREPTPARGRARADAFVVQEEEEVEDDFPAPPVAARPQPKTRPVEPVAEPVATRADDTLSSESAVRFDQQDALAEADFHMAYGLYDQAADLVKIAIGREPARRDLKLKLLEIYFVWGNKDLFLETARELHATRDQAPAGEWDKILIMGKQIAADDGMFKGEAGAPHVDLVDVNLEGGENRVDVDLFAEPQDGDSGGLDIEFTSGERRAPESANASDLDFLLDEPRSSEEEPTREMDRLARTQETPTIESPAIDRTSQTIRERTDKSAFAKAANAADQTAELSLDDLGLDVDALESTSALEETGSLEADLGNDETEIARPLRDDELTQLAPSLSSFDRTLESPRVEKFDTESTGTIYIDQVDLAANVGDTIEQQRPDVDSTASLRQPSSLDVDFDTLNEAESAAGNATVRRARGEEGFSDVFADRTSEVPKIDLDVGDALGSDDHAPTNRQATTEMELSELEPVTMSEVGTKLDLARAYMDMGDPDGARSILEEVLHEGNPNQKQEAQRLIDSIR